jgi:hypothetical protein
MVFYQNTILENGYLLKCSVLGVPKTGQNGVLPEHYTGKRLSLGLLAMDFLNE